MFVAPAPDGNVDNEPWGRFKVAADGNLPPVNYLVRYNTTGGVRTAALAAGRLHIIRAWLPAAQTAPPQLNPAPCRPLGAEEAGAVHSAARGVGVGAFHCGAGLLHMLVRPFHRNRGRDQERVSATGGISGSTGQASRRASKPASRSFPPSSPAACHASWWRVRLRSDLPARQPCTALHETRAATTDVWPPPPSSHRADAPCFVFPQTSCLPDV